jgi:hypothetical protein
MIEKFCTLIIKELGATGLLVVGLYFVLGKPLCMISNSLRVINGEVGEIRDLMKELLSKLDK